MNCEKYKNMIPEYISYELENKDRVGLAAHLEKCADCREALEKETGILSSLSESIYDIPEGLNKSILSSLPKKKRVFNIYFMRYAVAASLFFLILSSYLMYRSEPADEYLYTAETEDYILGSGYDDLISYNTVLFDDDKWTSENTGIFDSESDIINDFLILEELEYYDRYLTSL